MIDPSILQKDSIVYYVANETPDHIFVYGVKFIRSVDPSYSIIAHNNIEIEVNHIEELFHTYYGALYAKLTVIQSNISRLQIRARECERMMAACMKSPDKSINSNPTDAPTIDTTIQPPVNLSAPFWKIQFPENPAFIPYPYSPYWSWVTYSV